MPAPVRRELDMNSEWVRSNICTAPGFLERYFTSSRLHFLSIWKADLRDKLLKVTAQSGSSSSSGGSSSNRHLSKETVRTIMHVDMDCFFASVALTTRPELADCPVAIAHTQTESPAAVSTSEIASCNYVARRSGVSNGMRVGKARERCPDLKVLPYEFAKYERISQQLYGILMEFGCFVQAVSCDEALVDVSHAVSQRRLGQEIEIAERIRARVKLETGCVASIGIGPNILLARIATKKAKPDGVFAIFEDNCQEILDQLDIGDLPGIGSATAAILAPRGIAKCIDVRTKPRDVASVLDARLAQTLNEYARGIDPRALENKPRQSVGADVTWGVRFADIGQVRQFFKELSEEVAKRMQSGQYKGRHIQLLIKKRQYEGEPPKLLGHGPCENICKSTTCPGWIRTGDEIFKVAWELLTQICIQVDEIRGVGIHVSKIVSGHLSSEKQSKAAFLERLGSIKDSKEELSQAGAVPPAPIPNAPVSLAIRSAIDRAPLARPKPRPRREPEGLPPAKRTKLQQPPVGTSSRKPVGLDTLLSTEHAPVGPSVPKGIDVDPETWKCLPQSLRDEIAGALEDGPAQDTQKHRLAHTKELSMSQLVPSESQIDPGVLQLLPEAIRSELTVTKKQQPPQQQQQSQRRRSEPKRPLSPPMAPSPVASIQQIKITQFSGFGPVPVFKGISSARELYCHLDNWIDSDGSPREADIQEFFDYLLHLIEEMHLDLIPRLLGHMARHIRSTRGIGALESLQRDQGWGNIVQLMWKNINVFVQQRYNSPLKPPPSLALEEGQLRV
ncbi:uncharacterized protein BJ171DRAFT_602251 [Polychytrium aggregatum]|uniref:uncharacterized protein n=1 Tax=Polychytrium aggregatum TaxID=110093 RepID=UPI0022FEC34A|nr:uncharacterized protein BJ171DRAFT_602251 [Polychytrium aggregatum]KAI9197270.1 hypothetical protein BJ171DRAFT_602251 [Polychytrium aggregatum]